MTIEIVGFRLKDSTSRDDFLAQNKNVEDNVIMKMPGIVTRETAQASDGSWIVLLHWEKPEDAQNSMDKFVANPDTKSFTGLIDMDTFTMTRYEKAM